MPLLSAFFAKPTARLDTSKLEIPHQTSCAGYVTKQGKFLHSWNRRYLVLDGETLYLRYYASKTAYTNGETAKGTMSISSIERTSFGPKRPFGFKVIGHVPHKGYQEFKACVSSASDQLRWTSVGNNAIGLYQSPHAKSELGKFAKSCH